MKPCLRNRKRIALLALEALDAAHERDLRTHLENCPACHAYWQEMSALSGKLSSAQRPVPLEASERFHQRVVRAVRVDRPSAMNPLFPRWTSFAWRVALPVVGIGAVMVGALFLSIRHPEDLRRSTAAPHSTAATQVDLEPSVANYQMMANESLDRLDELLTRQGNRNPPPSPRDTGPASAAANIWE
jgi:anti-sigma factor RsiW